MNVARFILAIAVASVALSGADRPFAQSPLFVPASVPVIVPTGSSSLLLTDIDRDGHLDLVTKHFTNQTVSTLLGNGSGSFVQAPAHSLTLDIVPGAIALGDVNNDGALDLAVAHKEGRDERVSIFLANRNGGFRAVPGPPLTAGLSRENCCYKPSLLLTDLNGDGNLDLISANGRRNALEMFFGDGRGGFVSRPTIALEDGHSFYSFRLADVDGDGHRDLVTASSTFSEAGPGHVVARRGDGRSGFASANEGAPSVLPDPRVEAVADLDGDRHPDVVLSHGRMKLLTILRNTGDGTFTLARHSPIDVGMPAAAVVAVDVNGDHTPDLIMATVSDTAPFASTIVVLLGDGHGGFTSAAGSPFAAAPGAYNLAVGDVNEDGTLDIVASSFESGRITVLLHR